MRNIENNLYHDSFLSSSNYNPNLTEEENVQIFKEEYADQIKQAKDQAIKDDLKDYHTLMQSIEKYDEPLFYASDGTNVFTNTTMTDKEQFAKYPAYLLFGDYEVKFIQNNGKKISIYTELPIILRMRSGKYVIYRLLIRNYF